MDWHQGHTNEAYTALGIEKTRRTGGLEIVWGKDSDEQIILTRGFGVFGDMEVFGEMLS